MSARVRSVSRLGWLTETSATSWTHASPTDWHGYRPWSKVGPPPPDPPGVSETARIGASSCQPPQPPPPHPPLCPVCSKYRRSHRSLPFFPLYAHPLTVMVMITFSSNQGLLCPWDTRYWVTTHNPTLRSHSINCKRIPEESKNHKS